MMKAVNKHRTLYYTFTVYGSQRVKILPGYVGRLEKEYWLVHKRSTLVTYLNDKWDRIPLPHFLFSELFHSCKKEIIDKRTSQHKLHLLLNFLLVGKEIN